MANVVFYNFCYDVPVKIFAVNLLLGCIFLALPDALSLCRFFWSHKPAAPTATWIPTANRRAGRIAILVTEIVFAAAFLVVRPIFMTIGWHHLQAALRTPFPSGRRVASRRHAPSLRSIHRSRRPSCHRPLCRPL
jgi:hypothetical protein